MRLLLLSAAFALAAFGQCGSPMVVNPTTGRLDCVGAPNKGVTPPTTVTFSATPTFTVSTSTLQTFIITLTGNVTSSTLTTTAATAGQQIVFIICMDGTGGWTFTWPANVTGAGAPDGTHNVCSKQSFVYTNPNAIADSVMVSDGSPQAILTSTGTLSLPTSTDTLVARATTDTLTNKTLDTASNTLKITGTTVTGLQGTTGKLMTAGTISGTSQSLCTDINGSATTSTCPGFNPQDTTTMFIIENFMPHGVFNSQNFGLYGWTQTTISAGCGSNGPQSFTTSPLRIGGYLLRTATTTSLGCVMAIDGNSSGTPLPALLLTTGTFQEIWSWAPDSGLTVSHFVIRSGLGNTIYTFANPSLNAVEMRVDPDNSANIQYELITAGATTTSLDSGLAYDSTATMYSFSLRGDGTKLYFSVSKNGGAYSTEKTLCPSSCDMTASLPSFATTPFLRIDHNATSDSAEKRAYVHRFSFSASGLQ